MTTAGTKRALDLNLQSDTSARLMKMFNLRIVGQEQATRTLVDIVEAYLAGFCDPTRPAGNALFLGPTGTGKTYMVETFAEALFGDPRACLKIDCAEFQHSHEIAKLLGSPPGYLGHRETQPAFTQENLDKWHKPTLKLSTVLFDEIEKASDALWNLLLGILDKAVITTGDNRKVDFSKTIIIMTSNLGARQMSEQIDGGLGFAHSPIVDANLDKKLGDIATSAAKSKFSPEFMNRLQNIAVFNTLTKEQIEAILDIELTKLEMRMSIAWAAANQKIPFSLVVSPKAKKTLFEEGYSKAYGARHITRVLERRIQKPLAKLATSTQITTGDVIVVDDAGGPEFEFYAHAPQIYENIDRRL